jgi:hypothetical protein
VRANSPIDPMIPATDLAVAREFCGEKLGLGVMIESDEFLTFRCGGDSRLVVTRSSTGTTEARTNASWRDDEPGLRTVDGVADVGFALAACLVDPHGNSLGLLQFT